MVLNLKFLNILNDARDALRPMHPFEKSIHIFWLFGPFFLLIERSPADFWLSLLALSFAIKCVIYRERDWLKVFWVRASLVFWIACLVSSSLSEDPIYSLGEAIAWVRFPLFAMASAFWLCKDKRLLYLLLFMVLIGLLIQCGILFAELLIEGQKSGRLTWPYGDLMPGNYIAKVGLPVITILIALATSAENRLAVIAAGLAAFILFFSLMTGERLNFLICLCAGLLAGLMWRPKFRLYIALIFGEALLVLSVFYFKPAVGKRYFTTFLEQLPFNAESGYYRSIAPGFTAFEKSPFFGIGTGNYRNMCGELNLNTPEFICHPHPHNFFIQLAGETGLVGLITGSIFLFSIIWACLNASIGNRKNVVLAVAWVTPFAFFWPIATSSDFFGQWNNIFMWSAIAIALSSINIQSETSKLNSNNSK